MLTTKQKELLVFINARLQETGVPPSFDEMKEALSLQSKSGVHRLIIALEERGFIRRLPHRARAIEIIKLPEAMSEGQPAASHGLLAQCHRGQRPPAAAAFLPPSRLCRSQGRHRAAHGPHCRRRADQRHPESHPGHRVPPEMVSGGEHFALEVKGDSMIDAGINEGDIIICKRCDTAENGDIVVALGGAGRGDAETAAQEGRINRPGGCKPQLRDTHLRTRPSRHPGPSGGAHSQILIRIASSAPIPARISQPGSAAVGDAVHLLGAYAAAPIFPSEIISNIPATSDSASTNKAGTLACRR